MRASPATGGHGVGPSDESLRALDWLNLFVAALLASFGPFVALYLAGQGWTPRNIGLILTAGGLAGLATEVPAGELLDCVRSKRGLIALGTAIVTAAVLILALWPDFVAVLAASVLQGTTGGILGPGIAAVSLGLVGHDALAARLGRNQRFASIGGLAAAVLMGGIGYLLPTRDIFFAAAALEAPVLVALGAIRAGDIHFGRACGAPDHDAARPPRQRRAALFGDRRLLTFGLCLFLFQIANASILPLVGEALARDAGHHPTLVLAALMVIPQVIVALLAPLVGRTAQSWGRRPLLLIGFGAMPVRALAFAVLPDGALLLPVQALDGLTGATLGVLVALTVADLTKGSGRFNLGQGFIGTLSGVGAALSTALSGLVVERFGPQAGFLAAAAVALAAAALLWTLMPETRPPRAP